MADILEGTAEFNRGHALHTGEVPITVSDEARLDMFPVELVHDPDCPPAQAYLVNKDMFFDDTPLACGIENPEGCESCD